MAFAVSAKEFGFFQSEIVIEQLELHKPLPPGPPKYINYPLIFAILILVAGLVIVLANLSDKKIPLMVKSVGTCLVCLGLTAVLLRILFSYRPTVCTRCRNNNNKENIERDSETIGNINHGAELSNGDLSLIEIIASSEKPRSRQLKRRTSSKPSESPSEIVLYHCH